jgi:hypothetical protein
MIPPPALAGAGCRKKTSDSRQMTKIGNVNRKDFIAFSSQGGYDVSDSAFLPWMKTVLWIDSLWFMPRCVPASLAALKIPEVNGQTSI